MESKIRTFIAHSLPQLLLVYKRDTTTIINGTVVSTPAQYIGFLATQHGGRYDTDDPEKIAFLRNHIKFKNGDIIEVEDLSRIAANKRIGPEVVTGGRGTISRPELPAAPAGRQALEPVAAAGPILGE